MNIEEVKNISQYLQNVDIRTLSQSPQLLYELSLQCASWKAFTGEQMALAKKIWQDAKKKAYEGFVLSNEANQAKVDKYGVMVVKDYIASKCGDHESNYELIERTNNACGNMEDACRTVISALKEEIKSAQFQRA